MTLKEIETEVLQLDPAARARLAKKLLNSLDTLSEAERRNDQIERGVVETRRAEDVIRDARARLE